MPTTVTDRIEKRIVLRAPRSRVWRALTNADEFGEWFCVKFEAPFTEGETIRGRITHPGYEHAVMEIFFDRIPLARRAEAFRMNEGGWTAQLGNIERYVSQS